MDDLIARFDLDGNEEVNYQEFTRFIDPDADLRDLLGRIQVRPDTRSVTRLLTVESRALTGLEVPSVCVGGADHGEAAE